VAEEQALPLLQAVVDDADSKALGSTLEPTLQCPATASKTFHHDALQKDQLAQHTFHFDPPRDGCYLIEELHPQVGCLEPCVCKASANTNVHVNYCKGLAAFGKVDQTANAGQWTFLGAFPFYAGHPGNVTLSNEGTKPGTLALFDQIRFTWSGESCRKVESHPRQVMIRLTVDFKSVASRLSEFGSALTAKLAELANLPEKSLRLIGLRSGSIIAEFFVAPSVVDDPFAQTPDLNALQAIERLQKAVDHNNAELCALTGAAVEGCKVEFTDLGVAMPSVKPVAQQRPQQQQESEEEAQSGKTNTTMVVIVICAICSLELVACYKLVRSRKKKQESCGAASEAKNAAESEVTSMEEGKALDDKDLTPDQKKFKEEEIDNASTASPSSEDKKSEPSLNGDVETTSEPSLVTVKALSEQNI
jgi:hypothetical protein